VPGYLGDGAVFCDLEDVLLALYVLVVLADPAEGVLVGLSQLVEGLGRVGLWICRILFWAVLAPLFWTVGYYRLKETER